VAQQQQLLQPSQVATHRCWLQPWQGPPPWLLQLLQLARKLQGCLPP